MKDNLTTMCSMVMEFTTGKTDLIILVSLSKVKSQVKDVNCTVTKTSWRVCLLMEKVMVKEPVTKPTMISTEVVSKITSTMVKAKSPTLRAVTTKVNGIEDLHLVRERKSMKTVIYTRVHSRSPSHMAMVR